MANLTPFQVKVTLELMKGGLQRIKDRGFQTVMERMIYLQGLRDGEGCKVVKVEEVDLKHSCMGCTKPANLTYLCEEGEKTCLVIDVCEKCSKNVIMLSVMKTQGVSRVVSMNEAFGLTSFDDLIKDAKIPED